MLIRWLKFNAVGAAGIVVQIGALWILVEFGKLQYLVATAVATELAVIHNFVWHTRWTWADRSVSVRQSIGRLARFNLTNGAVSLIGNVILMGVLTGVAGVPYLVANMIAITTCSLLNFALSEKIVFGRQALDHGRPLDYGRREATAEPKAWSPKPESWLKRGVSGRASPDTVP